MCAGGSDASVDGEIGASVGVTGSGTVSMRSLREIKMR